MRREAFDELYDKQAKCAHCGHEYESHYQGAGGDYDWKTRKYIRHPCRCRVGLDATRCHCERFTPEEGNERPHSSDRKSLVDRILEERRKYDGEYGPDVHHSPGRWLSASMEELGEIARALHDGKMKNLPVEIVQLAALCLAWLEDIQRYGVEPMEQIAKEVERR